MSIPSFRKLELDLEVNKTTLHNWKKNRPKLYKFIITSYKDRELFKKHFQFMLDQKKVIEKEISLIENRELWS